MYRIGRAAALLAAALVLVACSGSGGGAVSFHTFCQDLKANQTIGSALFALENGLPAAPTTTSSAMATAATDAGVLAAEAPATGPAGTAIASVQVGADMNGVAQTLKTAAAKMANGDTSGYSETGPGAIDAAGDTNGLLATLDVVTSACTVFGG